ncbi:MAG: hypothetical protein IJX13_00330, partial [Clostridia bacterium]|nr:hypothetical protein [Clostridia bacterium]
MFVISEPNYAMTNWYKKSLSALKNQARKKRVQLNVAADTLSPEIEGCAFVLGGSAAWISQTVYELQAKNCHPIIVSELPEYSFVGRYSCVRTDYNRFMSFLRSYFVQKDKRHTAFY